MPDTPMKYFFQYDSGLTPYEPILKRRINKVQQTESRLTQDMISLKDFASGHEFFGLHFRENEWVFREWAPFAEAVFFIGAMTGWKEKQKFALQRKNTSGVWEIRLPSDALDHGDLYRLRIHWPGGKGDRIPAYARRVVQDPESLIFNAQVQHSASAYPWRCVDFRCSPGPLFIYESHVGMAQAAERVGTFREFITHIIPRIVDAGYNALQLMAIQEHPYYASFGYQVSSFFAPSFRFGTPEDFKELIDTAHDAGLQVIMDLIHSHAVSNEVEGLSRFDGTHTQYFHGGSRGIHKAWDSRCFDYGKIQVLHFLLSNCRFWLDEYRLDGFRFDGVTSMLYNHHGLGKNFTNYNDYFNEEVDEDALTYLALANKLIHQLRPDAVTIAEDVSGMPGLAAPISSGGIGFDYRFAMGIPDHWIKLVKDQRDEDWEMGHLLYELTNRRKGEKTISYCESHDQALVGDQTLIFRLIGSDIYTGMRLGDETITVDRGIALLKLIRFITLCTADSGYLNFMGNEFGHPEWIDFPRPGNQWSYRFARRQWHLVDDPSLKYSKIANFDRDMLALVKMFQILENSDPELIYEHNDDKVIVFKRAGLFFAFNFHPTNSYRDYFIEVPPGKYTMIFNSDDPKYGGHGRLIPDQYHLTLHENKRHFLSLYLPTRTTMVLMPDNHPFPPRSHALRGNEGI
jgi:1,4-alpha-glucan branching enzyme